MPPLSVKPFEDSAENGVHKNGSIRIEEMDVLIDSQEPKITKPPTNPSISFLQMLRYARGFDYLLLVIGLIFAAIYGVMPASNTIAFRGLTTTLMTAQAQYNTGKIDMEWFSEELLKYIGLYAVVVVISLISGYLSMFSIFMLCERQIFVIRKRFFESMLHQDISFFDKNEVGKLSEKISSSIDKIRDGTTDKLVLVISSSFSLCAGIGAAFYMSWQMGLLLLCIIPLAILNLMGSALLVKAPIRKESEAYGKAGSLAENVVSRIKTVLAFCGQTAELKRYGSHLEEAQKYGLKKVFIMSLFTGSFQALLFGSMSIAFWHGTNLLIEGKIDPGSVIASFWAAFGGAMRLGQALPHISIIMGAKVAAGEVFELIDRKSSQNQPNKSAKVKTQKLKGRVEFCNVSFSYPARLDSKALKNLSFIAEPGQVIALVGKSGSGKTTISNLLLNQYKPTKGTIKIDGIDMDQLEINCIRQSITIVPQKPVIFSMSVEENLKFGRTNITDKEMVEACKLANAHEFIKKLPKGYRTKIANGQLSGGQAQRLTIARALLANPRILILDECSSALDAASEHLLQLAFEKISVGRTIINISHKLPVKNAHKILVLDQGKLAEEGSAEELMAKNGIYSRLVNTYNAQNENLANGERISRPRQSSHHSKRQSESHSITQSLLSGLDSGDDESEKEIKIKNKASLGRILRFARPEYRFLLPGILCTILRGCSWPMFSIVYGRLFKSLSNVLVGESGGMSWESFGEFVLLGSVAGFLTFMSGYLLGTSGEKLTKRMRHMLFGKLLSQDGSFFDNPRNSTGKLTVRLSSDASSVAAAIDQRLADVLQSFVALVCGITIAFCFDYKMALLGAIMPIIVVSSQLKMTSTLKRRIRHDNEAAEETAKIVNEAVTHIRIIHAMNAQPFFYGLYRLSAEKLYRKASIRAKIQAMSFGLMGAYFSLNFSVSYFLGLYMIKYGYSTPFLVFQAIESTNMGVFSVIMVSTFVSDYLRARVAAGLIFGLLDEQPKIDSSSSGGLKPEINGNISLKNVCFSYPYGGDRLVLNNLNVEVKSGKTLALIGPSGGGKTSIINLLERFYDVMSGSIEIDGVDIRQINIEHLRQKIAIVEQQPTLFNLTIAENISYGMENASRDEIIKAAKESNIHEFIETLENKYDTMIGKDGHLSGGQLQRVGLARALMRLGSKILLLDEINSALDPENEQIIQETLDRVAKTSNKTLITISHRLNTITNSDKIVVIKNGQINESGTHEELFKHNGLYSNLFSKMAESFD